MWLCLLSGSGRWECARSSCGGAGALGAARLQVCSPPSFLPIVISILRRCAFVLALKSVWSWQNVPGWQPWTLRSCAHLFSGYSRKRGDGVQQQAWEGKRFHFHCLLHFPSKIACHKAGCWLGEAHGSCRPSSKHLSAWKQLVLTWAGKIAVFQIILNFPEV